MDIKRPVTLAEAFSTKKSLLQAGLTLLACGVRVRAHLKNNHYLPLSYPVSV